MSYPLHHVVAISHDASLTRRFLVNCTSPILTIQYMLISRRPSSQFAQIDFAGLVQPGIASTSCRCTTKYPRLIVQVLSSPCNRSSSLITPSTHFSIIDCTRSPPISPLSQFPRIVQERIITNSIRPDDSRSSRGRDHQAFTISVRYWIFYHYTEYTEFLTMVYRQRPV